MQTQRQAGGEESWAFRGVLRKLPPCSPDLGRALAPPPLPRVDGAHGAWAQTPSCLLGHLAAPQGAPLAARAAGWGAGGGGVGWRPSPLSPPTPGLGRRAGPREELLLGEDLLGDACTRCVRLPL